MDVPGKSNDLTEPTGALSDRSCQSGPLESGFRADVGLTVRLREGSETAQQIALALEFETTSTAHGQIRFDGLS